MCACKQLTRVKCSGLELLATTDRPQLKYGHHKHLSWSDNEVRALISIWREDRIQELDGAVRNHAIFNSIAKKMEEKGYEKHWQQCRNKIKS